jgi:hypothetical protein
MSSFLYLTRVSDDWVPPGIRSPRSYLAALGARLGGGKVVSDERGRPELVLTSARTTKRVNQVSAWVLKTYQDQDEA